MCAAWRNFVSERGGRPFLFDTVASYPGHRDTREKYLDTADRNGFAEATVAAPVVIADDSDLLEVIPLQNRLYGCDLERVTAPAVLLESSCVLVLSHIKGHELTGFGGALKNLGMGCVSNETKRAQHLVNMPQFNEGGCDGCGECAESCPTDAITMVDGRPEREPGGCIACSTCLLRYPADGWDWPKGSKERLQVYMAHVAAAVLSSCTGNVGFMNFIQDVVPLCDCAASPGEPIVRDVGIVFSRDPVAADKASLDLVDRSSIIPGSTTASPPDLLGKLHGTDSLVQLTVAEELGAGALRYQMAEV
ncbi:DUF362 domain-containing protein [Chloroflexota bacterium]